ncbi:hypothetical protein Goari_000056 [Gossypium aridum]|uniref:non-specific serine/threonine protein kinase n=1 Tax=Gossypium aridum TaxID=34290 RepID=A0A7J8YPR7_GOSAI|nr:hypothetical protein [Gossypium aridum]
MPHQIGNLKHLELLNLGFNNIVGSIPPAIFNSTLSSISLELNHLSGHLPSDMGLWLPNLEYLYLGGPFLTIQEDSTPLGTWRRISYHELHQATDGFSDRRLLGNGSYGSVYQGTLLDGMEFAVKVFKLELEGAFKSFDVECEVLRNIRHRNLIKIISSCSNDLDFKALVLEFMSNGSLDKWLYSNNHSLDILQRLNIMIDVASALEYLHHGNATPVVHCDLKPSNVLLDEDMVAHLSDFGIAKLLSEEDSMIQTMTMATIGYMAPGDTFSYNFFFSFTINASVACG